MDGWPTPYPQDPTADALSRCATITGHTGWPITASISPTGNEGEKARENLIDGAYKGKLGGLSDWRTGVVRRAQTGQ